MSTSTSIESHPVVTEQQWIKARKKLLKAEKEWTHQRDEISRMRRELPWVKVEKNYTFDSPQGKVALADLFGDRSQLIIYHFMFGPDWKEGCPSCSFVVDHFDGALPHLAARDVSLVVVSRAPIEKIEAFKERMGWRFRWVSSFSSDFNYDYHASFRSEDKVDGKVNYNYEMEEFPSDEGPGASVFFKDPDSGEIYHTYSVYARGLEPLVGAYFMLDLVPKGRDEDHLAFTMQWLRHHDRYGTNTFLDKDRPYWPANAEPEASNTNCPHCAQEETHA